MCELIAMCVQEEERLKVEMHDMVHLTMAIQGRNPSRKAKVIKEIKVMMHLTMGKIKKIRCNVIFSIRKAQNKILFWF